jgi:hypothetical protein
MIFAQNSQQKKASEAPPGGDNSNHCDNGADDVARLANGCADIDDIASDAADKKEAVDINVTKGIISYK